MPRLLLLILLLTPVFPVSLCRVAFAAADGGSVMPAINAPGDNADADDDEDDDEEQADVKGKGKGKKKSKPKVEWGNYKPEYWDLAKTDNNGKKALMVFGNTFFWGYTGVHNFMAGVLSQSVNEVAVNLVDIAMKPLKKTVHTHFNIWFKKTFPPTELQLAKRADKNGQRVNELLFNHKVGIKVDSFLDQLTDAAKNNEPLPSLLLYGPPGTGKTEIVKRLANEGNFEVIVFSAGELRSQALYPGYPSEKADTLMHIFNYASRKREASYYSRTIGRAFSSAGQVDEKIVIFIDEGEELLTPSDGFERSPELQSFLTATGTRSPNFTVAITTNYIAKIDDAAYRRFSYRIEVENPDEQTRLKIVKSYLKKYQTRYKGLSLDNDFLSDPAALETFYAVSAGLAGRELERVAQNVSVAAFATPGKLVTKDLLVQYIESEQDDQRRLMAEREKEEEKRKNARRERQRDDYMAKMEKLLNAGGDDKGGGKGKGSPKQQPMGVREAG